MPDWVRLYHHFPYPLRVLTASARGYYLRWWRYGSNLEKQVEEALERESWDSQRWKAWQEEQLAVALQRAATQVPYYREMWSTRRRHGDRASWEVLTNWPILKKETIRKNPDAFVAEGIARRRMFGESTSGTTGTPLRLWFTRGVMRRWYALSEARWRRWYGVSMRDRWGIIGGKMVVPFKQTRPPFWVWNAGLRQLYMSVLHTKDPFLVSYLQAIKNHKIRYLVGYTSSLYWLALQGLKTGMDINLDVVVTNAEPLFDFQRQAISDAFNCEVKETYGQSEKICAASECEFGQLHLWPEVGFLELLDEHNQPVREGDSGRIVSTSLLNDSMPFVRYEMMDMAQRAPTEVACHCGRGLPLLGEVLGRLDDVIITKDGRRLVQIDTIFSPDLYIREGQIIQETLERFRVKVVPTSNWDGGGEDAIRSALQGCVGDVEVIVETVEEIERTWAGKFRIILSELTEGQNPKARLS